jgi:restriction system protein
MPIPNFQRFLLPFLTILRDHKDHTFTEIKDILAKQFNFTDEELNELIPSGNQTRFDNRVRWTRTNLRKAGLLEITARATYRITERGEELLKTNPVEITRKVLEQYPEYRIFNSGSRSETKNEEREEELFQTPEERLGGIYQEIRHNLAQELLENIKKCSPKFFETLVVKLLVAMGYGGSWKDAAESVGRSHDGGIDGTIKEDKLGLDVVYIQAKRWDKNVGRPEVQAFAGSLDGVKARKGVFITASGFTSEAKEYVGRIEKKIVLVDGELLTQLMIDHGVGVSDIETYIIKRIDLDYFNEE